MIRYTEKHLAWLKTWYPHWMIPKLTRRFNLRFKKKKTVGQIRASLSNHRIYCGRPVGNPKGIYVLFTPRQAEFIRRNIKKYPHAQVADRLNKKCSTSFTEQQVHSFTANHGINSGRTGYFKKGNTPWNAGTKGKGICKGNSGNFKKGNIPGNLRPLGSERVDSKDGYILIKVRERNPYTGTPTRFKAKHVVLWERDYGPVPRGSIVMFKDGNMRNFSKRNLVCVTRSEHARLNQLHYHDRPKEIKPSVFALAKLRARIGTAIKNKADHLCQ